MIYSLCQIQSCLKQPSCQCMASLPALTPASATGRALPTAGHTLVPDPVRSSKTTGSTVKSAHNLTDQQLWCLCLPGQSLHGICQGSTKRFMHMHTQQCDYASVMYSCCATKGCCSTTRHYGGRVCRHIFQVWEPNRVHVLTCQAGTHRLQQHNVPYHGHMLQTELSWLSQGLCVGYIWSAVPLAVHSLHSTPTCA